MPRHVVFLNCSLGLEEWRQKAKGLCVRNRAGRLICALSRLCIAPHRLACGTYCLGFSKRMPSLRGMWCWNQAVRPVCTSEFVAATTACSLRGARGCRSKGVENSSQRAPSSVTQVRVAHSRNFSTNVLSCPQVQGCGNSDRGRHQWSRNRTRAAKIRIRGREHHSRMPRM